MSELTSCNHCNLERMRCDARAHKQRVTLIPATWGLGGVEVYVHPRTVNVRKLTKAQAKRYWRAWMMEVTEHCVC